MHRLHAGAACLNQIPLDWKGNRARIRQAIALAREAEVSLLCLPEMAITGYGCEDAFLSIGVVQRAWRELQSLVGETEDMAICVGLPIFVRGGIYNAAALVIGGRIAGLAAKQNLAGDGLHYEPRWFKPWPNGRITAIGPDQIPLGDVLFEIGGVRIGFEICEDAWVANSPGIGLAQRGADILLNPSASHFAFGKQEIRKRFVLDNSRAFGVSYVYANLIGNEAGRAIYDGGAMIASCGRLLAEGPRLFFDEVKLTTATIDIHLTRSHQARSVSRQVEPAAAADVCHDFAWPENTPPAVSQIAPSQPQIKEVEFARAVSLGLFDYLRKSHSRGFVVSLSGGADSGAVACLVALMAALARRELGDAGFRLRLGDWLSESPDQWLAQILTCVYQATGNSSEVTSQAAANLARALGANFLSWQVDDLVQTYTDLAGDAIGRELCWDQDDLALQNIQARVRAPGVWLLANIKGALLLSTSNRSEAAVGYATMDGDTCGGLSPIAGIDKAFLRSWLLWLETEAAPPDIAPVTALRDINRQQPTAELRPPDQHQTDEDDLMPYPLLDAIERLAIRDKLTPREVLQTIAERYPDYSARQHLVWVKRFFRLWSRNQWKRERYAPSFHLDDENLDPKTWCRFPILSGGFEQELDELS